jgi:hypothetical protein
MRWTLGGLVLLIVALTSGAVAVLTLGRCAPNSGVDDLGCVLSRGFRLATLGGCASLIALTLGTFACVITRKGQQWGWFAIFLSVTVSLGAAIALILVISNTPLSESMRDTVFF